VDGTEKDTTDGRIVVRNQRPDIDMHGDVALAARTFILGRVSGNGTNVRKADLASRIFLPQS
jgi:hypothetical protein